MAVITRAPTSDIATGNAVAYSSGTTGYNLLNDYPDTADPLTTYVEFGTTANSFIVFGYAAPNVPADQSITSVAVYYTDEEPSSGTNKSTGRIRVNTTYYNAATLNEPSTTTSTWTNSVWTTNPATSAAWTVDEVNNVGGTGLNAFGVIATDANPKWRCGSVQLVITTANAPVSRATDVGALTITGNAPTVFLQDPKTANPDVGALELTGQVPTAVVASPELLRVSWVQLEIPAQDPVAITTDVGALSLTGYEPTATDSGAGQISIPTDVGALELAGYAPDVKRDWTVDAAVGELSLTGYEPTITAGDSISIPTDVGALELAGFEPTAGKTESVTADVGALELVGYAPTAASSERLRISWVELEIPAQDPVAITSDVGALALTGYEPTPAIGGGTSPNITTDVGALELAGLAPNVTRDWTVAADVGALTLAGYEPTAGKTESVTTDVGALELGGLEPTAAIGGGVSPNIPTDVGALVLAGYEPTAGKTESVTTGVGALTLTGYEPTLTDSGQQSWSVETGLGELTLAGYAPGVRNDLTVLPGVGALTIGSEGPGVVNSGVAQRLRVSWVQLQTPAVTSISRTTDVGALTLTGQVPTAAIGGVSPNIVTGYGELALTGQVPTAVVASATNRLRVSWVQLETPAAPNIVRNPLVGELTITGYAPYLDGDVPPVILTDVGALVLAGYEPSNTYTLPSPGPGSLTLGGVEPTVAVTENRWANPDVGALTLGSSSPGVTETTPPNVNIGVFEGELVLEGFAPEVRNDLTFSTDVGALELTGYAPVQDAGVAAGYAELTIAGLEPAIALTENQWAAPGYADLTLAGVAPTLMQGGRWSITTGFGALLLTGQTPTVENSGDRPVQQGGGWVHWNPPRKSKKQLEEERQKLGILPKPVQRALKRAAAKVIERTEPEALAQAFESGQDLAAIEAAARAEISLARQRWRENYEYIVQALVMDALVKDSEKRAQLKRWREEYERDMRDQAEVAELWSLWTRM